MVLNYPSSCQALLFNGYGETASVSVTIPKGIYKVTAVGSTVGYMSGYHYFATLQNGTATLQSRLGISGNHVTINSSGSDYTITNTLVDMPLNELGEITVSQDSTVTFSVSLYDGAHHNTYINCVVFLFKC